MNINLDNLIDLSKQLIVEQEKSSEQIRRAVECAAEAARLANVWKDENNDLRKKVAELEKENEHLRMESGGLNDAILRLESEKCELLNKLEDTKNRIVQLENEVESFTEREEWCKSVEEGYEYPEKLNRALQRLFITIKHLEEGNPELALDRLKKFWNSILEWEEKRSIEVVND